MAASAEQLRPRPGTVDVSNITTSPNYSGIKPGDLMKQVARAINETAERYADTLTQISDAFFDTWRRKGRIIWMGNGGSAANASHAGADMGKRSRVDGMPFVFSLAVTDNVERITAQGNDEGYNSIFVTQLEAMNIGPNDTVVGLSGSGKSSNVLQAIEYANQQGATTVGITGFDGGKLAGLAKISVVIPREDLDTVKTDDKHGPTMAGTEDVTMSILHDQFEVLLDRIIDAKEQLTTS